MGKYLEVHPSDPQPRVMRQVVDLIREGGVVVYPTDSCFALGCAIGNRNALQRIRAIRNAEKKHFFALACEDLSAISGYARITNSSYRIIKALTPGPYTFILPATREVPKRLLHPKRRTIGLRVPDHPVVQAMLRLYGEPIMTSTLLLPGDPFPMTDAYEIYERIGNQVEAVIDSGNCGIEMTSVLDLVGEVPVVIRAAKGDVSRFLE